MAGTGAGGELCPPHVWWEGNRAGSRQSRRVLESAAGSFFTQVVDEPAREGALLDLSLVNKEELIRELKADGKVGCSIQELMKFKILRSVQDKRELQP